MIVTAKKTEIPEILLLTKACATEMISRGIYQWNEHYPSQAAFEKDIERKELYLLKDQGAIIGTIVLSTYMDEEYKAVDWLSPNGNSIYIHRLSIHPNHQKKGYARQLMDFAENHAKLKGFHSVRLDTFSQNHRNQKFYKARGYNRLGDIYFPKQSAHPFHCYELLFS